MSCLFKLEIPNLYGKIWLVFKELEPPTHPATSSYLHCLNVSILWGLQQLVLNVQVASFRPWLLPQYLQDRAGSYMAHRQSTICLQGGVGPVRHKKLTELHVREGRRWCLCSQPQEWLKFIGLATHMMYTLHSTLISLWKFIVIECTEEYHNIS